MDYKKYWTSDKGANLVAGHTGNPEGFDVVAFLQPLIEHLGAVRMMDVGCGSGRLCKLVPPERYLGVDLNPGAILAAKAYNPGYQFQEVDVGDPYPDTDLVLAYTVFLHMDDDTLRKTLLNIGETGAHFVLVAEILGREWRRGGLPPVFNRDLNDYLVLMEEQGFHLHRADSKVYARYANQAPNKNVRLFGLLFRRDV